jgi:hypothetical protein
VIPLVLVLVLTGCTGTQVGSTTTATQADSTTTATPATSATTGESDRDIQLTVTEVADSYPHFRNAIGAVDRRSIEAVEWLAYCAEAFGFSVTITTGPGQPPILFADATDEQLPRWVEVQEACAVESYHRGWVAPYPTTREQLVASYERLLEVNACLEDLGYGTTAPSLEAFLEDPDWNVYANTPVGAGLVNAPSAGEDLPDNYRQQLSIQEQCPLWP